MEESVKKKTLASDTRAWDGSMLPPYPAGQPEVSVVRIAIAPGARLAMHTHPMINAGMVIAGRLTVVAADGGERTFGPGEAIIEMVNRPHYGENRGADTVDLVMVYADSADGNGTAFGTF